MTQQWKASLSPGNAIEDMARLASQYETMVSGYDETLLGLKESVRQVTEERARIAQRLDEVRTVFASLTEATARAEQLSAAGLPQQRTRLQAVPTQDTVTGDRHEAGPPPSPTEQTADGAAGAVTASPRVKELLDLLYSRPGAEWTSMDVAALRGEQDRLGRKRLRNTLRDAVAKGFLERISDQGRTVRYRVASPRRYV